jgi:hypothetical protein
LPCLGTELFFCFGADLRPTAMFLWLCLGANSALPRCLFWLWFCLGANLTLSWC